MSRSKLILAAFAVSLSLAVVASARAEIFSTTDTPIGKWDRQPKLTSLPSLIRQSIHATLIDLNFPDAFQLLELGVAKTGSGPLLGSTAVSGELPVCGFHRGFV